jgi:hypothetical protein
MRDEIKRNVVVVGNDPSIQSMFLKEGHFKIFTEEIGIRPDILVFPGGADIDPGLYGETALTGTHVYPHADQRDKKLFNRWGQNSDVLKVGICRGAQFLNVMGGGAMWQDVDGHKGNHMATDLFFTKNDLMVTSTHHQMMIPNRQTGDVLCIAHQARSFKSAKDRPKPEFDTEVVWYDHIRSLCFQPHPEYLLRSNAGNDPSRDEHRRYFFDLLDYFLKH